MRWVCESHPPPVLAEWTNPRLIDVRVGSRHVGDHSIRPNVQRRHFHAEHDNRDASRYAALRLTSDMANAVLPMLGGAATTMHVALWSPSDFPGRPATESCRDSADSGIVNAAVRR